MSDPHLFTTGGAVQAGRGLYIPRPADEELLRLCLDGTFAYVLHSRQVGKTSLLVNTAYRLREQGVNPVLIDLQLIGANVSENEWYLSMLLMTAERLNLRTDAYEWWKASHPVGNAQLTIRFFRDLLLKEVKGRVVILIDEIDTTLRLPFAEDYLAAIRAVYNARPAEPEFNRLSFVLAGVATPVELIADPRRTPFNIGETVNLRDFTFEEALPFSEGLGLPQEAARQVLGWILTWSGGHPYLTQNMCRAVAEAGRSEWSGEDVDDLVRRLYLRADYSQDHNLLFVRDMLTRRVTADVDVGEVLLNYRSILLGHKVQDESRSPAISHLKLSGVVKSVERRLHVRNRIYREAFDERWVKAHMPPYSTLKRLWGGRR